MRKHLTAAAVAAAAGAMMLVAVTAASASPQIVGGTAATAPLTVSLQSVDGGVATHQCGGVQIAPQWVLTAGHCVPFTTDQARVGSLKWDQGGEVVPIAATFVDPALNSNVSFGNDVGLVKLATPTHAPSIAIGVYGPVGSKMLAQGWGLTCDANLGNPDDPCLNSTPENLQQLAMTRVADHFCDLTTAGGVQLNDPSTMMCVVPANGGPAGTCFGDSGSPVLQSASTHIVVVGISIALMNNTVFMPHICSMGPNGTIDRDAATKIQAVLPWILATMQANDPAARTYVQRHVVQLAAA